MKERIAEFSGLLWQRTVFLRSGLGLVIVVVALVGLRLFWIQLERPAHRREIAVAFGSASVFNGDIQMNHSGSQFIYAGTSPGGYGLFFFDEAVGHKQTLGEEHGMGEYGAHSDIRAWPWSPDDSAFVYAFHDKLVIQPSDIAKASTELPLGINAVTDLAWVNPDEFAYVFHGSRLCYVQKQADGQWKQHDLQRANGISSLAAVDTNAVAWLQDGLICRRNLTANPIKATNAPAAVSIITTNVSPPTNGLTLWLDASTLQQDDQSVVLSLADLSPSKNDAFRNGTPPVFNGPKSRRALNGKGTIHFASADSNTSASGLKTRANLGIAGNAPRTIFAVMHHDAGKVMRINLGDPGVKFGYFGLEEDDRSLYLPRVWNRYVIRTIMRSPTWNISEIVCDQFGQRAYVNGALKASDHFTLNTMDKGVEIGLRSPTTGATNADDADGDFAELMVYDKALGAEVRQQVESYLKTKWLGNKLLTSENPLVWCDPQMPGITGFAYSQDTGQFLLNKTENGKDSLWKFDPQTSETKKIAEAGTIKSVQWTGTNGCYYVSYNSGTNEVMLADDLGGGKISVFGHGDFRSVQVSSDGGKLLVTGTFSNQIAIGLWQYDVASKQLDELVSGSDHPSAYARNIVPFHGTFKATSGRNENWTIFPPPNVNPHKKYPILIGNTLMLPLDNGAIQRQPWMGALANCGAYVLIVNRATWMGGIENWGENVMAAYKTMAQNGRIDPDQVFLFSTSAETPYTSAFITNSPELWKGIIFLNPTALPDFSGARPFERMPKILISAGSEEHEEDRLKKFQQDSLKSGVIVEYILHAGENHYMVGNAAETERATAMTRFIFEE